MHAVTVKGILSGANGMNLYRGCSHGCIYCDARSACYHMDHAFEDIEVKENALELLEQALKRKRKPCMIATGAMTDPYIPLELKLGHMRGALELVLKYGFGVALQTKSDRVLRDLDLLREINSQTKAVVQMTLTTFDEDLCRIVEPNVCTTRARIETLCKLRDAGIPTVVWLSHIAMDQRHGRKFARNSGWMYRSTGPRNHMLWNGADPARRQQRVLLSPVGSVLPREEGAIHSYIWQFL